MKANTSQRNATRRIKSSPRNTERGNNAVPRNIKWGPTLSRETPGLRATLIPETSRGVSTKFPLTLY